MIVLDEQLGLWQLEEEIAKWYPGSVLNIKDFVTTHQKSKVMLI